MRTGWSHLQHSLHAVQPVAFESRLPRTPAIITTEKKHGCLTGRVFSFSRTPPLTTARAQSLVPAEQMTPALRPLRPSFLGSDEIPSLMSAPVFLRGRLNGLAAIQSAAQKKKATVHSHLLQSDNVSCPGIREQSFAHLQLYTIPHALAPGIPTLFIGFSQA